MSARFFDQEVTSGLRRRRNLSHFLDALVGGRTDAKKVSLTYIFCTDAHLHGINQQFLRHDDYTDIVTFDLSEKKDEICGEIYISTERVAENAQIFRCDYQSELHRVIFHGALHLCGLRDKTGAEQKAMRTAEQEVLTAWFGNRD